MPYHWLDYLRGLFLLIFFFNLQVFSWKLETKLQSLPSLFWHVHVNRLTLRAQYNAALINFCLQKIYFYLSSSFKQNPYSKVQPSPPPVHSFCCKDAINLLELQFSFDYASYFIDKMPFILYITHRQVARIQNVRYYVSADLENYGINGNFTFISCLIWIKKR